MGEEEDRTRDEGEKEISLFMLSSKRDPYSSLRIIDLEHEKRRNTSSTYLGLTFYNQHSPGWLRRRRELTVSSAVSDFLLSPHLDHNCLRTKFRFETHLLPPIMALFPSAQCSAFNPCPRALAEVNEDGSVVNHQDSAFQEQSTHWFRAKTNLQLLPRSPSAPKPARTFPASIYEWQAQDEGLDHSRGKQMSASKERWINAFAVDWIQMRMS